MPNQRAKPTFRRRRLGSFLKALRRRVPAGPDGLTVEAAAALMGWQHSKLSNIENARAHLPAKDVAPLLKVYGVEDPELVSALEALTKDSGKQGWSALYEDDIPPGYQDYIDLESDATSLRTYDPSVLHGLLQTGPYAKEVISSVAIARTQREINRLAEVRKARQSILTDPEKPLQLWAVIHESVLMQRFVGHPTLMREQTRQLLDLAELPNVTIQVMPLTATPHPGMMGAFDVFEFPKPWPTVVNLETLRGGVFVEDPDEATAYATAFERVVATALPVDDSRELMKNRMEGIPS
ncbi:helix-turn-helix transcriptional regulator [Streptomyces sp. CS014]|uniref:helix-turn-helix domain-containing protein n=1 Tax=Streptomyces sp. CS014 TaxID=2162707 RepID=UPI000D5129C4|nr:helix-turn-helix transcriptional regulator [Streptomyces sp. CS014]PVD04477.1 XRE family transcriptional regulator [Streptomyces sp. CS014]